MATRMASLEARIEAIVAADLDDATFRMAIERIISNGDRSGTVDINMPQLARRASDTAREVEAVDEQPTYRRSRRAARATVAYKVQYTGRRNPEWLPAAYREVWDALNATKGKLATNADLIMSSGNVKKTVQSALWTLRNFDIEGRRLKLKANGTHPDALVISVDAE